MRTIGRAILLGTLTLAAVVIFGGVSAAQEVDPYRETPPQVEGDVDVRPPEVADDDSAVLGARVERSGGLPVTGGDVIGLTLLGIGAIMVGTAIVLHRRHMAAPD